MSFEMDPEAYAPELGGYCAYGVALGETASSEPQAFFFQDGRLYFMRTERMLHDKQGDLPTIVAEAKGHWPSVLEQGAP